MFPRRTTRREEMMAVNHYPNPNPKHDPTSYRSERKWQIQSLETLGGKAAQPLIFGRGTTLQERAIPYKPNCPSSSHGSTASSKLRFLAPCASPQDFRVAHWTLPHHSWPRA